MRTTFLPFSQPSISEREIEAIAEILRSGWITTGRKCAEFEKAFTEYCCSHRGNSESIALSSATAAMHLILYTLGIGEGDEVITPSMTWVSTVNLIKLTGATPVFADIDRNTLMVTPESVARCITVKTKLILPVHFAGSSLDITPLRELAEKYQIPLVEDAAHALSSEYKGRKIGAEGTAIFSFHPIKNITTGEGGMICSDNQDLIERVRRLKFHGLGVDAYDRRQQGRAPQAEVIEPGFKYNLTDIAATLGLGQLQRIEEFVTIRSSLATRYHTLLSEIEELIPLRLPEDFSYSMRHAWHLYVVRLDLERVPINRDEFIERLKTKNIGCGLHFRSVHSQHFYKKIMPDVQGKLPETEWNSERIFSLPLFPKMTEDDQDDVITAIKEVLAEALPGGKL